MNIQDIAKKTGFSVATVSRTINQNGYVSEKTREKILGVIKKHKYVPSAVARSLSTSETNSIGVIIPDIENEFFSKLISGIADVAEEQGYHIMFFGTNESIRKEHSFLELVEVQRLTGIIITPISEDDSITRSRLLELHSKGMKIVLVDRDVPSCNLDAVFSDNVAGAYEGVRELLEQGHRKIATITGPLTSKPGKERYVGYLKAMDEAGISIPESYIQFGDFKMKHAYKCTEKLFGLEDPPTAIFTANNLTTIGCLQYLTAHKLTLGKDIEVLGFDSIDALQAIGFEMSYIDRDVNLMGRKAMMHLIKKLKSTESHIDSEDRDVEVVPCTVTFRDTRNLAKSPIDEADLAI